MRNHSICVVMACYAGDKVSVLSEAVDSMLRQTLSFTEFIVVVDGPVSDDISSYVTSLEAGVANLKVIWLKKNVGAAKARNIGMKASSSDYIAIMDSDDISMPDRLESQYRAIIRENVDAVWSWQEEFYDVSRESAGVKTCPEHHDQITKKLKYRCLLPDPSTFIRRDCFDKTGGYCQYDSINIDHCFFLKIAMSGFRMYCIQMPLIKVRVSSDQRKRRGGLKLFVQDIKFRWWMYSNKLISIFELGFVLFAYAGFRFLPNFARDAIYRRILRR